MTRAGSGPWYGNQQQLLRFEWLARRALPDLRRRLIKAGSDRGLLYSMTTAIPHYPPRLTEIRFRLRQNCVPAIRVDGPSSPHRMEDGSLCLWYTRDPRALRWEVEDGLLQLICITTAHLFKEAWWRDTEEWLGEEAPHGDEGMSA